MKKSQNMGDIFWRKKIDSKTIDLREIVKNRQLNTRSRISKIDKRLTPKDASFFDKKTKVPEYFAALEKYKKSENLNQNIRTSYKFDNDNPSKIQLIAELFEIDNYDLELQAQLTKLQKRTSQSPDVYLADNSLISGPTLQQNQITDLSSNNQKIFDKLNNKNKRKLRKQILNEAGSSYVNKLDLLPQYAEDVLPADNTETVAPDKRNNSSLKKVVTVAVFLVLMVSLPVLTIRAYGLKEEAQISAQKAYQYMTEGKDLLLSLDATGAQEKFLQAQNEFYEIEKTLVFAGDFVRLFASFPIQSRLGSTAHLLRAGELFSSAGYDASQALILLQNIQDTNESQGSFTDNIIKASFSLENAHNNLKLANVELSYIRPQDVSENFNSAILSLQQQMSTIDDLFESAFSSLDAVLLFLGHSSSKNYLLIFQNSSELRATGGFIGTYGLLKLNKGKAEDLFIEGIYYPDGQLSVKVIPPKPLQYVTPDWGTRDANWFFDFPTSAKKIMWFYERTGGTRSDGVIALTPRVLERLLELTGPIEMLDYGVVLSNDNFLELIQQEVEVDYNKELNRPKQILADLTPILIDRLKNFENKMAILNIFFDSLNNKDMQVYSKNEIVQDFILDRNWGGSMAQFLDSQTELNDYLSVVISNIGGWKTDKYTQTNVDTVTTISGTGDILRTVIISRKHEGGYTPYPWYNKPNYGYIKIYVPLGSKLISAEGFSSAPDYINTDYENENYLKDVLVSIAQASLQKDIESGTDIFEESSKTVFGNWLQIPAGGHKLVKLTYKLPLKISQLSREYNLTIQKQSGLDVNYSGKIEEFNSQLKINYCSMNDKQKFVDSFKFLQNSDVKITCNLTK